MTVTHVIRGRKVERYTRHHHRGAGLNKVHAVCDPALRVRDGYRAVTVCGATVRVEELGEVLGADGGAVYNCRPADGSDVTCRDCRKKLGL